MTIQEYWMIVIVNKMEEVKQSIVSTTVKYLRNLEYLAIDDKKLSNDIMALIVVDEVFDWASWSGEPSTVQVKLKKFRKDIIRNNPKIIEEMQRTNEFYKNVNTPQTIYTWQRVYDNVDVITVDDPSGVIPEPYTPPYFWGKVVSNTKPSKNQSLINSGTMVYGDPSEALNIPYNSNNTDYLWFAIPSDIQSKAIWYVDNQNSGDIGGTRNLFDTETIMTIRIPETLLDKSYKIYMTNYSTQVASLYVAESLGQIPA